MSRLCHLRAALLRIPNPEPRGTWFTPLNFPQPFHWVRRRTEPREGCPCVRVCPQKRRPRAVPRPRGLSPPGSPSPGHGDRGDVWAPVLEQLTECQVSCPPWGRGSRFQPTVWSVSQAPPSLPNGVRACVLSPSAAPGPTTALLVRRFLPAPALGHCSGPCPRDTMAPDLPAAWRPPAAS